VERGDLVLLRGFVLEVSGGTATVGLPGTGQRIEIPAELCEVRAAPQGPQDTQAYANALRQRFADLLSPPRDGT
jgi:hypothetical protein